MMLSGHVFVSCAAEDGLDKARQIIEQLTQSSVTSWLADSDLHDNDDPYVRVNAAIQTSSCFLLILTRAALETASPVEDDWKRALRYKKPIIVAVFDHLEPPPHLVRRPKITIDPGLPETFDALRAAVLAVESLEGMLATANDYLADAKYAKRHPRPGDKARIDAEIVELERQIESLKTVLADPTGSRERLKHRIELGVERERVPRSVPDTTHLEAGPRRGPINDPPVNVPSYFENRSIETKIICDFLRDETKRLLVVTGRGGVGKSALVTRVLRGLQKNQLPDGQSGLQAAGIVYLSQITNRHPTFNNLSLDLIQLLPRDARDRLRAILESGPTSLAHKIRELIRTFPFQSDLGPIVVLLDNMEEHIDGRTLQMTNVEIAEFIRQLLESIDCGIKLIITSRLQPKNFADIAIPAQIHLPLDEGLSTPFAENVFRSLDASGHVGLKTSDPALLKQLQEYTRGIPRAIEAVFGILSADRNTTIADILRSPVPPDGVVRVLVGEAYSRLDKSDQNVVQALAVFGSPVPANAVDYVLQPWLPQVDAARSLARLVNMLFVRKDGRFHYLHPIDREHALRMLKQQPISQVQAPANLPGYISSKPFALNSLKEQAADYFQEIQIAASEWRSLDDIESHISEFNLRLELNDEVTAAGILDVLSDFLDRRGAFQRKLNLGTALEGKSTSDYGRKTALSAVSSALWRMGRIDDAITAQQRLVAVVANNPWESRLERGNLAIYNVRKGEYRAALTEFEGNQTDRWGSNGVAILNWIGTCKASLGYIEEALATKKEALEKANELRDDDFIEAQMHNLASVMKRLGQPDEALKLYQQALQLASKTENPLWKANHLASIADVKYAKGDFAEASRLLSESVQIREAIADLSGIADAIETKALWALEGGQIADAMHFACEAIRDGDELGEVSFESRLLLAQVKASQGEWQEAERLARETLQIRLEEETWVRRNLLAITLIHQGKLDEARAQFQQVRTDASDWLVRCSRNEAALSGRGLAGAGLVMLGSDVAKEAIKDYEAARGLDGQPGTIRSRLWWLTLLVGQQPPATVMKILEAVDGVHRPPGPAHAQVRPNGGALMFAGGNPRPTWIEDLPLDFTRDETREAEQLLIAGYPTNKEALTLARNAGLKSASLDQIATVDQLIGEILEKARKSDRLIQLLAEVLRDPEQAAIHPRLSNLVAGHEAAIAAAGVRRKPSLSTLAMLPSSVELLRNDGTGARPLATADLERMINGPAGFADPAVFRLRLAEAEVRTARIDVGGKAKGTGFLVGDSLLLTNWHVVQNVVEGNAVAVFDNKVSSLGRVEDAGRSVPFAADWLIAHSKYAAGQETGSDGPPGGFWDFALVRLAERIGKQAIGPRPQDASADARGAYSLDGGTYDFGESEPILILGHPEGRPVQFSYASPSLVRYTKNSNRVRYQTNTEGGSSGSPVFNRNWRVVALHHASGPTSASGEFNLQDAEFNQGIPISGIVTELKKQLAGRSELTELGLG